MIDIFSIIEKVHKQRPLIYHIANIVTANDCANSILAIGGSPIVSQEIEEVEDLISISDAVVINIGTATKELTKVILKAADDAKKRNIPIILDPVGIGSSRFRTDIAIRLIEMVRPVIRCNYSEFLTLAGIKTETRGVDSVQNDFYDTDVISSLAKALETTIIVTGVEDIISNGTNLAILGNGNSLMEKVSGTGCICTSLIGATCAVNDGDYYNAAIAATALMGICGETASANFTGTASLKNDIIDNLSMINKDSFYSNLKLEERF